MVLHPRVAINLVVPADGLFQPGKVKFANAAGELHRFLHGSRLV